MTSAANEKEMKTDNEHVLGHSCYAANFHVPIMRFNILDRPY